MENNNLKWADQLNIVPVSQSRTAQDYQNEQQTWEFGSMAGYHQESTEQQERVIDAIYKGRQQMEICNAIEARQQLISRIVAEDLTIQHLQEQLQEHENALVEPEKLTSKFGLITAILYTAFGIIFFLGELGVTMQTVANMMGLEIDFDAISLSDFMSLEGLFFALAIAGVPFALKPWLDRYIIARLYEEDHQADRLFKWLLIPVGIVSIGFFIATGYIRYIFQPALLDPSYFELWQLIFMVDGPHAFLGKSFTILLVLTLFFCSAICLSLGLVNFSGVMRQFRHNSRRLAYHIRRAVFTRLLAPKIKSALIRHHSERELIQQQLHDIASITEHKQAALENEQALMSSSLLAGHHHGQNRRQRVAQAIANRRQQEITAEEARQKEQQRLADQEAARQVAAAEKEKQQAAKHLKEQQAREAAERAAREQERVEQEAEATRAAAALLAEQQRQQQEKAQQYLRSLPPHQWVRRLIQYSSNFNIL